MAKNRSRARRAAHTREKIVDAVHRMEPELQQLAGVLATVRIFGEAGDSIEPIALAALARSMEGSVDELTACWRQLLERSQRKAG